MEKQTYTDEEFNSLVTDLVQAIRKQKLVIFVGCRCFNFTRISQLE